MIELLASSMAGSAFVAGAAAVLIGLTAGGFWARRRLLRGLDDPAGVGQFRSIVAPYRLPLAISAGLALIQTVFDLAAPWPLVLAVDHAINRAPFTGWLAPLNPLSPAGIAALAAALGVALVALGGLIRYLTAYVMGAAAERIGTDLRDAAFSRLQRLSLHFHDRNRTGDLVSRLTSDVARVIDALLVWFQTLLPQTLTLLGMLALMVVLDRQIALAALLVVPLLAALSLSSRPRIKSAQLEVRARHGTLAARATEVLRNVRAVQAFGREEDEQGTFRRENTAAARSALSALDIQARYGRAVDLVLGAGSALILYMGVMRVTAGTMTVGVLLVILTYLSGLYSPIRSLTRLASTLARGAASRERLMEIFAEPDGVPEHPEAVPLPPGPAALTLRHVTFGYVADLPVLRGLTLDVRSGETVCIVGPSGAGKTTLLMLLLRFYDPDAGVITLGGVDLRRLSLRSLRSRAALVPQDAWILDGSIADNIRFGRSDATDREVAAAARLALVDEFAARFPDGYETPVGESGALLSGGQRRRLALARAVIRDAAVLLLDEPTSGLDPESAGLAIDAIRRTARGRTVVIVSHDIRIAAIADRVLELKEGRIVEQEDQEMPAAPGGRLRAHTGARQASGL